MRPGSSRPAVLIRVYVALLTGAKELFNHFGVLADPYMTLVGYFNSSENSAACAVLLRTTFRPAPTECRWDMSAVRTSSEISPRRRRADLACHQ